MEERKPNKYEAKKIINIFNKLENELGGQGIIDYLAITPNEFSVYIRQGVSMILISELNKIHNIIYPDTVFFNENHPQLIVSNTSVDMDKINDEDMQYAMNFVKDCAEFICPCTGSQIHICENEIKIFVKQYSLIHNEYIGVYNLLDESQLIFKTVFEEPEPYLSIMCWEDVINE